MPEMPLREQRSERAVRGQQSFLFSARQKKVRRSRRVGRPRENERIVLVLMLPIPRPKDGSMTAPLLQPPNGKRAAGDIEGCTYPSREREQFRMTESQVDRSESSHGNAHNRPVRSTSGSREFVLHIGDEIFHDVVLVAVLRRLGCIHKVRRASFRHDENQAALAIPRDIGIIRPVAKTSSPAMEQVHHRQLCPYDDASRHHHAILHISKERHATEGGVDHFYFDG